jgi:hypothetical protein
MPSLQQKIRAQKKYQNLFYRQPGPPTNEVSATVSFGFKKDSWWNFRNKMSAEDLAQFDIITKCR